MIEIRSNLFISSIDVFPLVSPNINATVSLLTPPLSSYPQLRSPPPYHLYVPISDTPTDCLLTTLADTLPFIHCHRSRGVLVHCFHGVSRSVATVLAYLIWIDPSKRPLEHLQDIRTKHPNAQPSASFLRQLDAFYTSATCVPNKYFFPPPERHLNRLEATELLLLIKHSEPSDFERLFVKNPVKENISAKCRICRQPLLPHNSLMSQFNHNVVSILPVKWMASSCVHRKGKLKCSCGTKIGRFNLNELSIEIVCSAVDWM